MEEELKEDESVETAMIQSADNDFVIFWNEFSGLSGNNPQVVANIVDFLEMALEANGGDRIKVTPEGPFLLGTEYDAASVAWAVNFLYGSEVDVTGDLPTMRDLGLDYSSNFNEDGSQRVR